MKRRQHGIAMLEILGALMIGALLLVGLTGMIDISLEDAKGNQAAHQQSQLASAARKYIAANYASLVTASASAVVPITVAQLQAAHFLPASFSGTNIYGQTACVLVRQPSAGKLDALVVTYGGNAIPDKSIAAVAAAAGQGGGYINRANHSVARGASWSLDTTNYRSVSCSGGASVLTGTATDAGHLVSSVFYDGPGQLSTDFVYRDAVPGRPELNQMNTPLQMGNSALVAEGALCGTEIALAVDSATRRLMVCGSAGRWTSASAWKSPVANYAALSTVAAEAGDVRLATDTNRAFAYNGTTWVALAVDQDGNLRVPNDLTVVRNADVYNDMWTGGTHRLDGGIISDASIYALTGLETGGGVIAVGDITTDANVVARGNVSADGDINALGGVTGLWQYSGSYQIGERMYPDTPCNYLEPLGRWTEFPVGTIVADLNGVLMSCNGLTNTFQYGDNH